MTHVTVMTGPERRRRWSLEDRRRILTAAFSPGAVVSDVARQFDVVTSLVYKWRRQALAERGGVAFAQAILIDEGASPSLQPRHDQQNGCDGGHTEHVVGQSFDQRRDDRDGGILGRHELEPGSQPDTIAITVELSEGRRVNIGVAASAALVTATLPALR